MALTTPPSSPVDALLNRNAELNAARATLAARTTRLVIVVPESIRAAHRAERERQAAERVLDDRPTAPRQTHEHRPAPRPSRLTRDQLDALTSFDLRPDQPWRKKR